MTRTERGAHPLAFGVEVQVKSRTIRGDACHLEVVAGRRFAMPGAPTTGEEGESRYFASVAWESDEEEICRRPEDLKASAALRPLVDDWLRLVEQDVSGS